MYKDKYTRYVQTSVTVFIYHGDDYLFLKRNKDKRIDPGLLNGIGGKLEPGEDFATCAVRETAEETGYVISPSDLQLVSVAKLEEGYEEDWVMCFFKVKVSSKKIPLGNKIPDGELLWIHKDEVLKSGHKLIYDLPYVFDDIVKGKNIVMFNAVMKNTEEIEKIKITKINK